MTDTQADLIDKWSELYDMGYRTNSSIAERIGVHKSTLEKALARARKAGDKRVPAGSSRDAEPPSYDALAHSPVMDTKVRLSHGERHCAVRHVAGNWARDATDLEQLLDALGLYAGEGRTTA